VGLVGVKFGCPGTIGFGTRRVHERSRVWMEQDQSSSSPYDNLGPAVKPLQSPESAVYIMDSLLGHPTSRRMLACIRFRWPLSL